MHANVHIQTEIYMGTDPKPQSKEQSWGQCDLKSDTLGRDTLPQRHLHTYEELSHATLHPTKTIYCLSLPARGSALNYNHNIGHLTSRSVCVCVLFCQGEPCNYQWTCHHTICLPCYWLNAKSVCLESDTGRRYDLFFFKSVRMQEKSCSARRINVHPPRNTWRSFIKTVYLSRAGCSVLMTTTWNFQSHKNIRMLFKET